MVALQAFETPEEPWIAQQRARLVEPQEMLVELVDNRVDVREREIVDTGEQRIVDRTVVEEREPYRRAASSRLTMCGSSASFAYGNVGSSNFMCNPPCFRPNVCADQIDRSFRSSVSSRRKCGATRSASNRAIVSLNFPSC